MRVEFINPFVTATQNVFHTMLNKTLARGPLALAEFRPPIHEVNGLIGLTGKCQGMVVLSIGRSTAIAMAEIMLGERPEGINGDVIDAVGELTNMIAGAAKAQLAEYDLSVGLPTVISGKTDSICFPSCSTPFTIPFDSDIGPLCVEVGLVENPTT